VFDLRLATIWLDAPISLSIFGHYHLAVVVEDHTRSCMSHLKGTISRASCGAFDAWRGGMTQTSAEARLSAMLRDPQSFLDVGH
jgi:hypothetical protein